MTTVTEMLESLDTSDCRPGQTWTTGNIAEAFPGVFSTFGLTFCFAPMEVAFRRVFRDLGVYPASEVHVPELVDDCFWTVFSGWGAGNIDKFRQIANVIPGTSATAVEEQLFGYSRPDTVAANTVRRYPAMIAKAPRWLMGISRRHDAMLAELRRWRLEQLRRIDGLDEAGCIEVLADARRRFEDIMSIHMGVALMSSSVAEKVGELANSVGLKGLEARLLSGVGADENDVAHDLWAFAHDQITLKELIDGHGYHGPGEGQLHGMTWREDPSPILARIGDYRSIPEESPRAPRNRSAAQAADRERALKELLPVLPAYKRLPARLLARAAQRFLALREQGKAGYLLTYDVTRATARRLGAILVERDVIDQADDVFHLAYDSLVTGVHTDRRATVEARRAAFVLRQSLRLPQAWTDLPEVTTTGDGDDEVLTVGSTITGVAASGGVVEGIARVVRDPGITELDDGDILVGEATDPSWVSLFLVAGGVVTDYGGLLSHGAIVARELGIPCVCGTEVGSHRIRDGQRVRVDADKGVIEVID